MELPAPLTRKHVAALVVVLVVLATVAVLVLSGVVSVSLGILGGTGDPPPQGSFHVEDNGDEFTIVRDVGGSVNATKLEIRVNGQSRGTWYELSDGAETVGRGDRITIEAADSGDVVALYWTGGSEGRELIDRES